MAALSITAANVLWTGGTRPRVVKGGEAGTRGMPVYKNTSDNEHYKTDADALATAAVAGILLTDMNNAGDCLLAVKGTRMNIGATAAAGIPYVAGPTAGEIVPYSDLASGDFANILFWGEGTALVTLILESSPVAI